MRLADGRLRAAASIMLLALVLVLLAFVRILPLSMIQYETVKTPTSALIREKTWDWFKSDLIDTNETWRDVSSSSRHGGTRMIWPADSCSTCSKGGDAWDVLSLPAIAEPDDPLGREPGEILWDDDYGYGNFLRHEQNTQPPRNWSALYQQRPAPEEGNQFKAEWLSPYTTHPPLETLAVYGGSDYAVTSDGGDYTCHVVVGLDSDDRLYLLDLWRGQSATDVWIREWCRLVREWKPLDWAEETGQITSGVGPFLEAAGQNETRPT